MNVLITGGTGLIGTALTTKLLSEGHKITIVSRHPERVKKFSTDADIISWNMDSLVSSIEETDVVINLAGASIAGSNPLAMRWTKKRKAEIMNSRIQAGTALTQSIHQAKKKPEVLIQASAIGYYGNTGDDVVNETAPPGEDFLADICQSWEASTKNVEEINIRRVIIRIGLVFSQYGGLFQLLRLPFEFFLGGKIGAGKQHLSWIHIEDLVSAIQYLIENKKAQGHYNLTSPNPVQYDTFSKQLGETLNKPVWFTIPAFVLKLALGQAATLAIDGRAVYPKRLLEAGFNFKFDHLPLALKELTAR